MEDFFESQGPIKPGEVVLVFTGQTPPRFVLRTWLETVATRARSESGDMQIVVMGLHSSITGRNSVKEVVSKIKDPAEEIIDARLIELGTEQADDCLAACPFGNPNAVIAILDVERLRFPGLESNGPMVTSADGTTIRLSERDDLSLPHIEKLCIEICQRAPVAGQKWLILSRGYGFDSDYPSAFDAFGNLTYYQLEDDEKASSLSVEFRQLLGNIKAVGLDAAFGWIAAKLPTGKIATIARANIFSISNQPLQAYHTIREVAAQILQDGVAEEIIQLAQMASAAGAKSDAEKTLSGLPNPATMQWENLRAAHLLAKKLDHGPLRQSCIAELKRRFPNEPLTLFESFNALLDQRDYLNAAVFAEKTGHPFRREVALFYANPSASPEALLHAANESGYLSEAYWIIAKLAKQRKQYAVCREYALRLVDDDEYKGTAAALRVRALAEQIPNIDSDILRDELLSLFRWCAVNPTEIEPRFALESLSEKVSTQLDCLAQEMVLLRDEIKRLSSAFDLSKIPVRCALEEPLPFADDEKAIDYIYEVFSTAQTRGHPTGMGRLSAEQAAQITPQLWADLGKFLECIVDDSASDKSTMLLHTIMAMARETGDPASDLLAARQIASLHAGSDTPQCGLDLAESLLTLLPGNHSNYKGWRLSVAWLIYADVSLRLGNAQAALRFLCFACYALNEPPRHARLFLEIFRTAARVARDVNIPPLAVYFIGIERKLLESFPDYRLRHRQLDQMELSISLSSWRPEDGPDKLLEIACETIAILNQCKPSEEIMPLLTIAMQAAWNYEQLSGGTPLEIKESLERFLLQVSPQNREILRTLWGEKITVQQLRALATKTIRSSGDWALALKPALVAARKALSQSCESGDSELFWTACLIVCQPGMGVRVSENISKASCEEIIAANKWLAAQLQGGNEHPLDAVRVQRAIAEASDEGVGDLLFTFSLQDFLAQIAENEVVVMLATDDKHLVYRCELRRGSAGIPTKVTAQEWDAKRFARWSRIYPAQYGHDIEFYFGHLCKPPASETKPTIDGLLPAGRQTSALCTVVVEGRLFGFAHRLASDLAGTPSAVCVCPSARWLGAMRSELVVFAHPAAAWLGAPNSGNVILKALQDELTPILKLHSVDLIDSDILPDLRERSLVVLGSHGGAHKARGFTRLTDDKQSYEPERVASALAGSTCVILGVCHGGRGDEAMFSHETTGLTSSLLRHGVRCVVASLWPVDVSVVVGWMDEFVRTDPREPIAVRVDKAQQAMAKRPSFAAICGEHPLMRCAFTVFGDGSVKLPFPV